MKILVANLGSTSFKYRLFDMQQERQLARGGVERIGEPESRSLVEIDGVSRESVESVPDHAVAVRRCLEQLTDPEHGCLQDTSEVSAIGLKAVHGGHFSGAQRVTPEVLHAMEEMNPIAPAHNPPYIAAMRLLGERLPEIPLVAVFETGFHSTMPDRNRYYAVPRTWADQYGIARWGFHGASHGYIAARMAEILQRDDLRVISCHLGGSSSLCASRGGKSLATSMGMSPQSGLPQNNRVGDFDPFALPLVMEKTGKSLNEVLGMLAGESGLLGLSELSGDLRDIRAADDEGNKSARLALEVYVGAIRHYLGAYLVELGGADAIVFTGGIGENDADLRSQICADLEELGIVLDITENTAAQGEAQISSASSRTQIWVVPTNEEIVVARKTVEVIEGNR
jgi:acetate kinase